MAQDPKIGREILPIPDQPYRGPVPFDARGASAPPQPMLHAPKGAPNVVIVLVDDMGFGVPSGFGGCMNMPTTDRLAKGGLCYNQFHTTAGAGWRSLLFSACNSQDAGAALRAGFRGVRLRRSMRTRSFLSVCFILVQHLKFDAVANAPV